MKLKLLSYSKAFTGIIEVDICICKNDKSKEYKYCLNSEYIFNRFLCHLKYQAHGRALALLNKWKVKNEY
jgi:hypothetical protein